MDGSNPSTGDYVYHYHDHLGSVRRLRAQDKSSLGSYEFTPYGQLYSAIDERSPLGFTGHEWDPAAGTYSAPARHYSPEIARWTGAEPLGNGALNLYDYAFGNPIRYADPTGLAPEDVIDDTGLDLDGPLRGGSLIVPNARRHPGARRLINGIHVANAAATTFTNHATTWRLRTGEHECQSKSDCFWECVNSTKNPFLGGVLYGESNPSLKQGWNYLRSSWGANRAGALWRWDRKPIGVLILEQSYIEDWNRFQRKLWQSRIDRAWRNLGVGLLKDLTYDVVTGGACLARCQ